MTALTFFVPGLPQTQAGMREVTGKNGKKYLISTGSKDLKPWRKKVSEVAAIAANRIRWVTASDCPMFVGLKFYLPMPSSERAELRKRGIDYQFCKPDVDKLTRAIYDSLTTACIYDDDGQVARAMQDKCRVFDRQLVGVEVVVRRMAPDYSDEGPLLTALRRRQGFHPMATNRT